MEENSGVVQPTNETQTEVQNQESQVTETKVDDIAKEIEIPTEKEPEVQPNKEKEDEKKVEEKEEEKEDEEFNPEDIDLEDEEEDKEQPNYKDIEGYDLEYVKDIVDFDNPESVEYIKSEMAKLKKAGFTQEQAQLYIDSHLNAYKEDEIEEKRLNSKEYVVNHLKEKLTKEERMNEIEEKRLNSKEYVVNHLKEKLTKEERMNYKPILSLMNEISSTGAFPKEWVKDAMSNPNLVKILNGIYKHQTNTNKVVEVPTPKQKAYMTPSAAFDKYKDWIVSQPSTTLEKTGEFIEKNLKPYILEKDMAQFNQIFKSLLKK